MNRPPPYFPQNQLSPPDERRYRRFKMFVGIGVLALVLIATGLGFALYYFFSWLF